MRYFFAGMFLADAAVQLFACANKNLLMLRRVSKCLLMPLLAGHYGGNVFERAWSLCALVGLGLVTFFGTAWLTGALDRDLIAQLRRRRVAKPAAAEPGPDAGKAE